MPKVCFLWSRPQMQAPSLHPTHLQCVDALYFMPANKSWEMNTVLTKYRCSLSIWVNNSLATRDGDFTAVATVRHSILCFGIFNMVPRKRLGFKAGASRVYSKSTTRGNLCKPSTDYSGKVSIQKLEFRIVTLERLAQTCL